MSDGNNGPMVIAFLALLLSGALMGCLLTLGVQAIRGWLA